MTGRTPSFSYTPMSAPFVSSPRFTRARGGERVLEDDPGTLARGEGDPRGEGGSARPEVRRQPQVVGGGDGADAHALRDAARNREIGLEHVGAAQLRDLAEVVPRELALPGCDRDRGGATHLGEPDLVVRRHPLLEAA